MNTRTRFPVIAAALCMLSLGLSGSALAHGSVDFNLSVGVPGVVYGPVYAAPPEVVYVPRPAYYPPAVYYPPAYYAPGPRWEEERHRDWERREWRHHNHRHEWRDDDD